MIIQLTGIAKFLIKKQKCTNCAKRLRTCCITLCHYPTGMTVLTDFKINVFKVLEGYMPLSEFEEWLYKSAELHELMTLGIVLEAYSFNYKQRSAKFAFKEAIFRYLDEDEFLLWKIKSNLGELINGSDRVKSIVIDFYELGNKGYPWSYSIGYYEYMLDNSLYDYGDSEETLNDLKAEAAQLFSLIMAQENDRLNFKLSDFRFPTRDELAVKPKFTGDFWK